MAEQSDQINLRVTYLIAGNPRPPFPLGLVPVSTTIADLKVRLQQELEEHPLPHDQRLIYQGRPLLESDATLQEALRLQGPIGPDPYTIHIIIAPTTQEAAASRHPPYQHQHQHDQQQGVANSAIPSRLRHLPTATEPVPRPSSAPTQPQQPAQPPHSQLRAVLPPFTLPPPAPQPPNLGLPFASHLASLAAQQLQQLQQLQLQQRQQQQQQQQQYQPQPTQTTVWLLSSGSGPQALLFAPGHGYFTSASSDGPSQATATSGAATTTTVTQPSPTPTRQAEGADGPPLPQPGPVPQPQARDQVVRRVANPLLNAGGGGGGAADDNDLLVFALRRVWLFLRLYIAIFVVSQPGTLTRYLLLLVAIVVTILPRQNPLSDVLGLVRRHIDRLIGPPPRPPRDAAEGAPPPENTTRQDPQPNGQPQLQPADLPASSTTRTAARRAGRPGSTSAMPSPEEAAQRLLREHRERNPTPLLDTLYAVEQAVVLFLASLLPGVGERHVAAREEMRREEREARARAAQERAAATAAADQQQQQQLLQQSNDSADTETDKLGVRNAASTTAQDTGTGTSSAVDVGSTSSSSSSNTTRARSGPSLGTG